MRLFSCVVEMVAARPRATFLGAAFFVAAGDKELVFPDGFAFLFMPEWTAFASPAVSAGASLLAPSAVRSCWAVVLCGIVFSSFVFFFMVIGFAVGDFEVAKSDVFSRADLAGFVV